MLLIAKNDGFGKIGELDLNGVEIETPAYFVTRSDLNALQSSPLLKDAHLRRFKVGVTVEWLDRERLDKLMGGGFGEIKSEIGNKIKKMVPEKKIVHFAFKGVKDLSPSELLTLLDVQAELGMDVIEVPDGLSLNPMSFKGRLETALQWKEHTDTDAELMGIAAREANVKVLVDADKKLDCYGISLNYLRSTRPMLNLVYEHLKPRGKWIHSFSTPRSYYDMDYKGTIGPLINFYGIDTFSCYQQDPEGVQDYIARIKAENAEERRSRAEALKFFDPTDYEQIMVRDIRAAMEEEYELRDSCPCPVCADMTVGNLLADQNNTFYNIRSHEAFSYANEADGFRDEKDAESRRDYIRDKKFASRFIPTTHLSDF